MTRASSDICHDGLRSELLERTVERGCSLPTDKKDPTRKVVDCRYEKRIAYIRLALLWLAECEAQKEVEGGQKAWQN
jgi:hypothetical protein